MAGAWPLRLGALALIGTLLPGPVRGAEDDVIALVDAEAQAATALAQDIWSLAELGYQERASSAAFPRAAGLCRAGRGGGDAHCVRGERR